MPGHDRSRQVFVADVLVDRQAFQKSPRPPLLGADKRYDVLNVAVFHQLGDGHGIGEPVQGLWGVVDDVASPVGHITAVLFQQLRVRDLDELGRGEYLRGGRPGAGVAPGNVPGIQGEVLVVFVSAGDLLG
ncbi:TPA_asm: UL40.5 [Human alphaherpesvirus 1]|nr:TPA_asm: UL40.5 [Human alphaherpesvirus 1]